MFLRELRVNLKSFILWASISIAIFLVVFLVYPSIINSAEMVNLDEILKAFPEEMLKAFNMDISSIDTAFGWLKSEGFVFILLITSCYAGILGSNLVLKEESDKTIEYLAVLPIRRTNVVLCKVLAGLIYVISLIFVIGLFNLICLAISGDFNVKQYILLSSTPLFPAIIIFFICMFVSVFMNKTKKMLGISLAIVLVSYLLNTLSAMSKSIEFLKYFSVFTLADIRNVVIKEAINPIMIIISLLGSCIFLGLTIYRYNKKEFI